MSKEEHEGLDNTNSIARIIDSGDENEIRMILGDRERIRHAGIVRPGIKIPKSTCSKAEKIKYEELYAQGIPFDEIDRQMSGEPKSSKSKLRPLNVDYFTVRECDFRSPADARFIMDNYADDDGKLRRIPCWFSLSELHLVIPHGFRAFGGGGVVRACSYYEGDNLMCRFVSKDVQNPKKDDWQTRPCDSDNCEAYAKKRCKFGGLIKSHIPGLKGMGEIIVATTSWYGLADAVANLKRIAGVLGRFNGLFNNEPFLELCKVQERVKTPDGKHVNQYIVTIEPSVDLMELAQHCDPASIRNRAAEAHSLLGKHKESEAAKGCEDTSEAVKGLEGLAARAGLSMDKVKSYIERDFTAISGVSFEDMSVDELRTIYTEMHARLKKDKGEFIQYVCDVHQEEVGA